jgi:hypothetical protein
VFDPGLDVAFECGDAVVGAAAELAVGEEPEPAFDLVQGLQRVIAALHRDLDLARPSSRRGDWQPGRERPGALALSQAPVRLR